MSALIAALGLSRAVSSRAFVHDVTERTAPAARPSAALTPAKTCATVRDVVDLVQREDQRGYGEQGSEREEVFRLFHGYAPTATVPRWSWAREVVDGGEGLTGRALGCLVGEVDEGPLRFVLGLA